MLQLPAYRWIPSPNYSSRGGQRVRLFVVHDCQGSYAGSISWFAQSQSNVSAHAVLKEDGSEVTQMVEWGNKAWHACGANPYSESLEMAGYAEKGFDAPEWQAAANVVAFRLKANGLPPVWAQHGNGEGFCSHYDLGAFGGGHTDPTTDSAVWQSFVARVQDAYSQPMPASWGGYTRAPSPVPTAPAGWAPHPAAPVDMAPPSIEWVQAALNAKGAKPTLIVDGLDGPATKGAIAAFQRKEYLYIDGIVGPNTIAALQKAS